MRSLLTMMLVLGAVTAALPAARLQAGHAQDTSSDISGMYTFLREGEFVQITVEEGRMSGYISRFGDTESDRGEFIDQFFDKTSLQGDHLSFNTKTIHGVWFEFSGTVAIVPGRKPGEEGYRVIKGTLIQHATDAKGGEKTMQRQVDFKSFPADLSHP